MLCFDTALTTGRGIVHLKLSVSVFEGFWEIQCVCICMYVCVKIYTNTLARDGSTSGFARFKSLISP